MPLLIPTLGPKMPVADLLDRVDGVLLTGSPSNVEPERYGGPASRPGTEHDPRRDSTTLPLIRAALEKGVPVLAICRGNQELNVALGGTLHQEVHLIENRFDHRADQALAYEDRYLPRHPVKLLPGLLKEITGQEVLQVNSLHWQGIDRLAPGLAVEAVAEDGTIEAVRVTEARCFALGVQWHPEWTLHLSEASRALFEAFGDACRERL